MALIAVAAQIGEHIYALISNQLVHLRLIFPTNVRSRLLQLPALSIYFVNVVQNGIDERSVLREQLKVCLMLILEDNLRVDEVGLSVVIDQSAHKVILW